MKKYLKIIANLTPFVLVASTTAVLSSCSINKTKKINIGELSDKIKSKIKKDLYMYSKEESKIIDEFKKALVEVVYEENGEFIDIILDVDFFIDYQGIDETKSVKIVSLESSNKICGEISISLMRNLNNIRLNNVYIKEEYDLDEKIKEIVKDELINDNDYKLIDKNDFDLGYLNLEIIIDKINKKRYILVEPNNKKINPNSYSDKKNMFFSGEKKININIKKNISKLNENQNEKLAISEYDIRESNKTKETIASHLNNALKNFDEKDKIKYSDIDFLIVDNGLKLKAIAKNESNSIYGEAFFDIKKIDKLDERWFKSLILSEKNETKWRELIENSIRENNKGKNKEWFEETFKHLEISEIPNINNKKILRVSCWSKSLINSCNINIYQVYDLNEKYLKENFDKKISNKKSVENIEKDIINFIRNDYINKNVLIPNGYDENKIKQEHISTKINNDSVVVQSKTNSLLFINNFKFKLNDEKIDLSRWNDSLYIPSHWINNSSKCEKLINKKIYDYLKKNILSLEESDFEVDIKNQKILAKKESKIIQGSFNFKSKTTISIEIIKDKIPPINTNNLENLDYYVINAFEKESSNDKVTLIKDVDFKIINNNDKQLTIKSLDESEKTFGEFVIKYSEIIDISYLKNDERLPILYEGDEKYEDKIVDFIDIYFHSFLKKDVDYKISGSIKDFNGYILVKAVPNNPKIIGEFCIKIKEKINIKNIASISNISITKNSDLEQTKKEAINKINEYKRQREEFKILEDITEVDIEASKYDNGVTICGKENSLKVKGQINIIQSPLYNLESLDFANDEIKIKRWFTKYGVITSIINYLKEKVTYKITEKDIDVNEITEQSIRIGQISLHASEKSEFIDGKKEIHLPELKNLKEYIANEKFDGGVLSKDRVRERINTRINSIAELNNDGIKEGEDYKIDFLNNSKNDPTDIGGQAKITILKNEKCQRLYYDNINEFNNEFCIKLNIPNITNYINTFSFVKDKYYYSGGRQNINDIFKKSDLARYNLVKHIYSIFTDPIVKFEIPEPKEEVSQKQSLKDDIYWYILALNDDTNNLHFVDQKKDPSNPKAGNVFWKFQKGFAYIRVIDDYKDKIPFYFERFRIN